ncbi:TetR/AcrR family transcriptional regulator [Ferrimonas pelagia]|uniref:TetR/AcrR family transcriptional regulator n=1 Tax=Ferrimonas pelagia TaxID=1177826 RepID=A0ABP9F0L4_9GAMM
MSSQRYHHGDLKQALLDQAQKMLRDEGVEAMSLRRLAAAAGVSHMAPYAHFKNKAELLQAVATEGLNALAQEMERVAESISEPAALVLEYGVVYVEYALQHPQLYRLMLGQVGAFPDAAPDSALQSAKWQALQQASKRPFRLLQGAFALVCDDEVQTRAQALGAWSLVHGVAALITDGHIRVPQGMNIRDFLMLAGDHLPGTAALPQP